MEIPGLFYKRGEWYGKKKKWMIFAGTAVGGCIFLALQLFHKGSDSFDREIVADCISGTDDVSSIPGDRDAMRSLYMSGTERTYGKQNTGKMWIYRAKIEQLDF